MKAYGDFESVNLSTGELGQRVSGDGDSVRINRGPADWTRLGPQRDVVFGPPECQPTIEQINKHVQQILNPKETAMSWSVSMIGTPEKISDALDNRLLEMKDNDYSKIEFGDAVPHLKGLLAQTFNNEPGRTAPTMKLVASGHGVGCIIAPGVQAPPEGQHKYRTCSVSIENFGCTIV